MADRRRIFVAWLPALAYMALIWTISSIELPELPLDRVPLRDKGVHFIEYAVLGFFVAHAALRTWPAHPASRTIPIAIMIGVAWGTLDEIHQSFVPGRYAEVADIVADSLGATAGAFARLGARWLRRR
jgi:VanZ family protein